MSSAVRRICRVWLILRIQHCRWKHGVAIHRIRSATKSTTSHHSVHHLWRKVSVWIMTVAGKRRRVQNEKNGFTSKAKSIPVHENINQSLSRAYRSQFPSSDEELVCDVMRVDEG